jgi:uroporphyrinogen decarboxylase
MFKLFNESGTKLFSIDSDGNMNALMDSLVKSGINVFYPCEPAAGVDIVKLRKKYGEKIAFKGGIDKHVLRGSKNDIIRELEYKLQPAIRKGTVFGLDHRITNGTLIENYRFYVKTASEMLGRSESQEKNWRRMAF